MNAEGLIYFDNNATTKVLPEVLEAMLPYFSENFVNPTSAAGAIQGTCEPLHNARDSLSALIECSADELVLTSGATEANNWVIQSVTARAVRETNRCHILVSAIEHPSVLETVSFLTERQSVVEVDIVPVTEDGVVELCAFRSLLRPDTALVSVMLANNETGVIQPIADVAAIAKASSPGCLVHTDATQVIGKIPVGLGSDLQAVDLLSLSAHKFHGPKGIGALFIRSGTGIDPLLHGGGQQGGLRSGTDNPALAAGMAKAAEIALSLNARWKDSTHRAALEFGLSSLGLTILGARVPRLPNTSLVLFPGLDSERIVHELLMAGFAVSSGSACSYGSDAPSHVVLAMGVDYSEARGALRISLSHENTHEEVAQFLQALRYLDLLDSLKKSRVQ